MCKNLDRRLYSNYSALNSTSFSPWRFLDNKLFLKSVGKNESSHGEASKIPCSEVCDCPIEQPKQLT